MAETIDDITLDWSDEEGTLVVKELKKHVLTKGAWTTIVFLYQELDKKTQDFGPPKMRVARYRKMGGRYSPQSKFNISTAKQARQVMEIIEEWLPDMEAGS
jgi:hypothetical protein